MADNHIVFAMNFHSIVADKVATQSIFDQVAYGGSALR